MKESGGRHAKKQKKSHTGMIVTVIVLLLITAALLWLLFFWRIGVKRAEAVGGALVNDGVIGSVAEAPDAAYRKLTGAEIALLQNPAAERIYAHRGGSGGSEEENTLAALEAGYTAGAVNLEMDAVMSADGTLYLSHDLTPYYAAGVDRLYANMTDKEIDALTTYGGNHVARLSDVFGRFGTDVYYYVELKDSSGDAADAFLRLVDEYGLGGQAVVQSQFKSMLKKMEEDAPDMPKLLVIRSRSEAADAIKADYVDILGVRVDVSAKADCRAAQKAGKKYAVWTMYTESDIRAADKMGVDAYFADDAAMALKVEAK